MHNESWTKAGGVAEQGKAQRARYLPEALSILDDVLRRGQARGISSQLILRPAPDLHDDTYTALASPLFDRSSSSPRTACGILVQLLPVRESIPLDPQLFFHRFAELLPSGLAILDHEAKAVFVNKHFWELTTHYDDDKSFKGWPQSIHPDDYDRVIDAYNEAFKSQKQLRTEFRAQGQSDPWRLLLLTPLGNEDLQHASLRTYGGFICSIVDITAEKAAAIAERKSANDARERREQLTAFFDTISHEIRNPMSAVVHSTEDIEEAIQNVSNPDVPAIKDAVDIIEHCVSHMKSIVDDVLSVSKLDSAMLSLVPKACAPSRQLAITLKMFHSEFRKQDIQFSFEAGDSCRDGLEVMCDPARIGQIIVNLMTNAIKFTRNEKIRQIRVRVDIFAARPTSYPSGTVQFADHQGFAVDVTENREWGKGEALYLAVAVIDSGIGISDDGQSKLFDRFQQATPKTEQMYGGSGLGLNISRKLCNLHGGEIGVSSKENSGSTVSFYVKTRRVLKQKAEGGNGEFTVKDQIRSLGHKVPEDLNPMDVSGSLDAAAKEERPLAEIELEGSEFESTADASPLMAFSPDEQKDSNAPVQGSILPDRSNQSVYDRRQSHVLLVEDNLINQRIVLRKLNAKGFRVTTANNGREAVDAVLSVVETAQAANEDGIAFDLVLMDQEMPIMNGNAACRRIREIEHEHGTKRVPVLGVTANVRDAQQEAMKESGMDDVISKPYKIDELVKRIRSMTAQ